MKENRKDKLLRLWKIRQEAEGIDVSKVTTLEQAEHFFDKKETKPKYDRKALMEEAKELGIKGYNKMKNNEIVEAIEEAKKPVITEEEVQSVANAIVDEAKEQGKEVQDVVNDIVQEGNEEEENADDSAEDTAENTVDPADNTEVTEEPITIPEVEPINTDVVNASDTEESTDEVTEKEQTVEGE